MNIELLRNFLQSEGVIFVFSGAITQEMLSCMAENLEQRLKAYGVSINVINNLFGIFIEQMHNIISYSKDKHILSKSIFEGVGISMVGYCKDKNKYYVTSGNKIDIANGDYLKVKINNINIMSDIQVKELYKNLRRSGEDKHDRGAGLGLLEMRKKSSELLEYEIQKLDDQSAFFYIKAYV